jgi:hypothetical protein
MFSEIDENFVSLTSGVWTVPSRTDSDPLQFLTEPPDHHHPEDSLPSADEMK